MVKMLCDVKAGDFTWELEETIRESYPPLFTSKPIFEDKNFFLLGRM